MGRAFNVRDAVYKLRREQDLAGERFVDLRLDFELEGEILYSVGDRWDRRLDDYDGETEVGVVVRMHPGQRRAIEWFKTWMEAHAERRRAPPPMPELDGQAFEVDSDPSRVYSALFAGGRRGGKTWIAVALAVAYAIRFPSAIVWIVSPSHEKHDEIRRYMQGFLAEQWIDRETASEGWDLCNGSRLMLKSGHDPDGLKEGKADFVVLNEGQKMAERVFIVARGAIVDSAGCVLVCANPPVEKKDQQWVADFAASAAAGKRAAIYIAFNPLDNPHIDRAALLSLANELDERTAAIEIFGEFRGPKDAVAHNWLRLYNEIPVPPNYIDVTTKFLEQIGEGANIDHLVGLDVQRIPYIGGPWYKFFVPPGVFPTLDTVLAWIVGETVLEGGDEVEFCDGLREAGLDPESTLIVCDATAEYQHSRRRLTDEVPPEWHGRGSWSIMRAEGYRRIVAPDRKMRKKNPAIQDRIRAFTSMICSKGERRLFADPTKAPKTCEAIREWRQVHGAPSRTDDQAHLGDGVSYPIIRIFPRRLRPEAKSGNPRPVQDPVASRVDNVIAMPARTSDLRITPARRGSRTRGL